MAEDVGRGLRVFGPDRDPVSGFEPAAPGFYWHAAIGGYGIQTSAALGAFAAARILGRPMPAAAFEDRFLTGKAPPSAVEPGKAA